MVAALLELLGSQLRYMFRSQAPPGTQPGPAQLPLLPLMLPLTRPLMLPLMLPLALLLMLLRIPDAVAQAAVGADHATVVCLTLMVLLMILTGC